MLTKIRNLYIALTNNTNLTVKYLSIGLSIMLFIGGVVGLSIGFVFASLYIIFEGPVYLRIIYAVVFIAGLPYIIGRAVILTESD